MNNLRIQDIYWIAGFLEGEGSFCRCGGTIQVSAAQVEKEPIDKLHNFLGGNVRFIERDNSKWKNYYQWCVYGENAEHLIKTIYPIMSSKRQSKISELLSWYESRPGRNFVKTGRKTCRKGLHAWNDENTFYNSRGNQTCRLCSRKSKNKSQRIIRQRRKQNV